jgi:hypothetical protein
MKTYYGKESPPPGSYNVPGAVGKQARTVACICVSAGARLLAAVRADCACRGAKAPAHGPLGGRPARARRASVPRFLRAACRVGARLGLLSLPQPALARAGPGQGPNQNRPNRPKPPKTAQNRLAPPRRWCPPRRAPPASKSDPACAPWTTRSCGARATGGGFGPRISCRFGAAARSLGQAPPPD